MFFFLQEFEGHLNFVNQVVPYRQEKREAEKSLLPKNGAKQDGNKQKMIDATNILF